MGCRVPDFREVYSKTLMDYAQYDTIVFEDMIATRDELENCPEDWPFEMQMWYFNHGGYRDLDIFRIFRSAGKNCKVSVAAIKNA